MEECPENKAERCRRGYYSELVTNTAHTYDSYEEYETSKLGADKKAKLKWKINTAVYSPIIKKFDPPITQCFLAPAERWMCYEKEKRIAFPVDTFKPRVQMQHDSEPRQLPRNVEVERRRRLFLSKSIIKCLENLNVPAYKLIPGHVVEQIFGDDLIKLAIELSILPLEVFDNEEYDTRTPQGWMDHGLIDGVRHPIPGQAFLPIPEDWSFPDERIQNNPEQLSDLYRWTDVAVTAFDHDSRLYSVLTLDGLQRPFEIPRIYLMFKAEDPEIFAERVKYAVDYRQQCEQYIRFEFYLDCMILTGTAEIDDDSMDKIYNLASRNDKIKFDDQEFIEKVEEEIRLNHRRALGEMQFRHNITVRPALYSFLSVPPRCVDRRQAPERGCVAVPPYDYNAQSDFRLWIGAAIHHDVYWAIRAVVQENAIVERLTMFTANYVKQLTIDEFEKVQRQSMKNLMNYLNNTWTSKIEQNVRLNLRHAGRGWYDIAMENPFIYDIAKLSHIMQLVKYFMESALHTLVFNSVNILVNLTETPCQCTLECTPDYVWGEDLIKSKFKPASPPIFALQLMLNDKGAYYSTDPTKFGKLLLSLFDTGLLQLHTIPQVHPVIVKGLKFPPDLPLSSVGLLDEDICELRDRMVSGYEHAIIPLLAYAKEYDVHADLFAMVVTDFVRQYKEENHPSSEVKEEVSFHYRQKRNLESTLPANIIIGPFYINVQPLKLFLINKRLDIISKLLDMFCARMKISIEDVLVDYKLIMIKLNEKPTSIEHIYEIKDWMETIPVTLKTLEDVARRFILEYEVLDYFWYALPQEDFENKWEAIGWPYKIHLQIEATNEFLYEETQRFYTIQLADEQDLEDKIECYTVQVQLFSAQKDAAKTHEIAVEIRRLWKNMKEAQEQGVLLNQRQKLFLVPVVPFDHLNKLLKEFEPYKNLWITASDWLRWHDIWMDNPLVNIDGESIDRNVTEMYKTMVKCMRTFADMPAVQSVAVEIRRQIEEFKPLVPLIQAIRSPGMRERHWEQFKEETGINIVWSPVLTFNNCLSLGVVDFAENIVKIADNASKEYQIELLLNKMYAEWDNNLMELTPYKTTGTYIMKVADEILQQLDDHIVMTQQLSFSPFKGAFETLIEEWEETLKLTTAVIEEWIELQKQWMYLEPIFTSDDISRQLPVESKKYGSMERTWRRIMRNAKENPKIIAYCPDKKLLESLRDALHLLEIVQKGLSEYLETKRNAFPRLYFLSDDELLEILSQARNPMAVQPHLRKVFENIARLQFEEDLEITKMFSADDESVDLRPTLYPTAQVETWLVLVENSMKNTVRLTFGDSFADMAKKDRKQWVLLWPGQIVIAGCQTFWTAEVEKALLTNKLKQFFTLMLILLDGLRSLVKGSLSNLKREVLSALIVIEVHARDVTQNLVDENVVNVNDFEWIKQLRYYWISEELKVRAVNAEFQYGYEYLGNSGRLVITPLTDRCYLTLTGALHLKFGGAPAGPAGTGKTETTKDLAKAFAIQCVVFNCSDQLDFMAMGKFLKGLASSGAWACFDEFNRIDIEVLSVVAQQITTIQKAQQARADRFMFEGVELVLKQSCAVFITMNPGYAGRTELPDNLKALFRPVAMMVPNYSLIAEISLFSFGFSGAKQLAEKITTTFKLSSEQLSSQDHYDFGMRAVKTVIAVAGNLKREKPDMEERQIVLRALRDVNVPKFLKDDLKLFNGIVSDLFPRMEELAVDYGDLELSIRSSCKFMGLEDVDDYVKKVIQLYETTVVRHGLMLVGPTGSGKTKCYEILKDAMTKLKGKPSPSGYPFQPVFTYVLNPKSITMGQLYGEFDLATHEWTDGILPSLVRADATGSDKNKRWYVFDGPVDAVWIENMNTVLDDNKKLCLSSGEIIKLRDTQTMMFEVADLAVASPATVSRCGMVYLEPGVLGLQPYINCWLNRLPEAAAQYTEDLRELCEIYLLPSLDVLRGQMREIVGSVDSAIVQSFLSLMDYRLSPLLGKERPPPAANFLKFIPVLLVPWVTFSLIWSVGGTCDYESRVIFSNWVRRTMIFNGHKPYFPTDGLVYDYKLHDGGFTDSTEDNEPTYPTWHSWMERIEAYVINPDMNYSDIEVPTIDNIRNAEMIGILLMNENNVLCVGPTGTGKTLTVSGKLSRNMHKKFICDFITFSARTSANQTQDLIDSKLDRRRKGVFGPPILKRQVFFIDDFNMPALEVYGAQPPIELIRQWMDFKGWYDRRSVGEFRNIIDVNFVAAMGPPGGGRNPVTARCLRHFHYITFTEMEDSSKLKIFGTILRSWLVRTPSLLPMFEITGNATLYVYKTILAELLPTPAKTHYTFNLRDLSKVFQGMLMLDPETVDNVELLARLWFHENCRVYQDRLVNDEDRLWFDKLLRMKLRTDFKIDVDTCIGEGNILFGDFLDPTSDVKLYKEITDMAGLVKILETYLEEYNANSTRPMKLVLFLDAIKHVSRISRIIRQPMGNALLLGMGGSGRQSLTRLATHMAEFNCFQIELSKSYGQSEWREDIKQLMLKAGLYNSETVFLFSDTQIKSESFLEDLNNILNSGDVPNIYQPDEMDKIYQNMKVIVLEMGLAATKSNLFSVYTKKVRSNLHTVISMSPIGEIFRARLRQFPALVNCCTIDWFSAWPESALQSVALQFLADIEALEVSDEVLNGIVVTCQYMHASVVSASERFLQQLSRHNYVTPTSYLELLSSYTELVDKRKGELIRGILRLRTGLDKLLSTAEEVKVLQANLEVLKPALAIAAKDAEVMIEQIAEDTLKAEETKAVVEKEEAAANEKKFATELIAQDAQKDLAEALPALMAAEKSLQSLNKNDITEVRAMKRPPVGVIFVIEAICIVKDIKPNKVPGPKLGEKLNDYWEPGRNMMSDPGQFLQSLMNFDKESITESMINALKKYVNDPAFQPEKILQVSKACTSLCMWVHAMYKYYFVNLAVAPKRAALKQAMEELAETERALAAAQANMQKVLENLEVLNEKLRLKVEFKEAKENEMKLCEERMNRAVRLVGGLSDERVRWMSTIESIEAGVEYVTGDILICAGAVAYLTPFTDSYRRELLTEWTAVISREKVPYTTNVDPVSVLGDPVMIRRWQLDGLPRDALSVENAVLVAHSRRWPLFIDPQGQANKWIKNSGKDVGIHVVKLADKDLIRTLESAIRFGKPMLIENVATELDPALDPVLQRQLFRQSGQWMLKLGDNVIPYNFDFRLYITTKLPNPHYTPEVSIKVLLVNFTLVPSGLQDQLLALVVMQERPDLEEARSALVISSALMRKELKDIEDRILYKLSASEGSPVDDIDLITTLEASKIKSQEIKAKVESAEITQLDIDMTRAQYIPVANRGQILFFCLADLPNIDPMYQYSLEWYVNIFVGSMANTEKCEKLEERVEIINDYLTFSLFSNVCRSLFEKHKMLFAFLVCVRILLDQEKIDAHEWHFFLAGGSPIKQLDNPAPQWLSARSWKEILALQQLPKFESFINTFGKNLTHYKHIFDSKFPHRELLPAHVEAVLDDFEHLLVLKCLRPDKVTDGMQDYLVEHLGQRFVEPQTSDLTAMFQESSPTTPLIFVLSTGTDPAADLYKFADRMRFAKRMSVISLGQGQGPRAEKMIEDGMEIGQWVFFQNCHLAPSWMPRLERLVENISPDTCHRDFRIWLTSTPSPHFPASILQNGSKMTVEPPRGVKANMLRAYMAQIADMTDFFHSDAPKVPTFRWLLFSLCLFHGVLIERRKFGPLGFNIPYEFTDGDLRICISQLHMFLLEYADIPFKVLVYTAGHINYGGRVTDDWDRRCLMNLLADYYKIEVVSDEYVFDAAGKYYQLPSEYTLNEYLEYIRKLPINDDPDLFGLHFNADISRAQADTYVGLATLLALQPRSVGGSSTNQDEITANVTNHVLSQIPEPMDMDAITAKYPVMYEESLNTVLVQEVIRFNRLLKIIKQSLRDLLKALKGLVVMSEQLEAMANSLFVNQVPAMWASKAYPSLKPLGAWVSDLNARVKFLLNWVNHGIPPSFWISGFYFPQAFLTGTLQNYARKYVVSIDTINFGFKILHKAPTKKPNDGCCIYGLFLEGSRWNSHKMCLDESFPKELYTDMPTIWMVPEENHHKPLTGVYECPVYKTLTRAGTLSTTGHSTNYVVAVEIPSEKSEQHWIKRGVALICALDY